MENLVVSIVFITVLALIITFAAGVFIGKAHSEFRHMREQIAALEAAQAKHLPYHTADEIENATAAILRIKQKNDFDGVIIENALAHLQQARNGNVK